MLCDRVKKIVCYFANYIVEHVFVQVKWSIQAVAWKLQIQVYFSFSFFQISTERSFI